MPPSLEYKLYNLLIEQEDIVKNYVDVTEDYCGQSWKNGPHYYYYDHISDSD